MTPLEKAINEACRLWVRQTRLAEDEREFEELDAFYKFTILEVMTALVAPAIKAYEEAKADEPGN